MRAPLLFLFCAIFLLTSGFPATSFAAKGRQYEDPDFPWETMMLNERAMVHYPKKAVRLIEAENTLLFETERQKKKAGIKREVEETFNVKVEKVRTFIKGNKKYAYVRLDKKNLAIDVATKLGMI